MQEIMVWHGFKAVRSLEAGRLYSDVGNEGGNITLVQMHVFHVARAGSYGSKNLILEHELADYVVVPATNTCLLGKPTDRAAF
jgi:hypothetical protein